MIIIYGASGTTGQLIAKTLARYEVAIAMAGRDSHRLRAAADAVGCNEIRCAPVHDEDALIEIFADADVVVNCAGPFSAIGEPVVRAALAADCHYIDTTGEQSFVRNIYERYESTARRAGRVVVNACAFEVALGDWAASVACAALDTDEIDRVDIAYAVSGLRPTKGTQLSILDALGKTGSAWQEDRWVSVAPASERRDFDFPEPFGHRTALSFPSGEVITVPRHVKAKRVQSYVSLGGDNPLTRAASLITPVIAPVLTPMLGAFLRSSLGDLARSALEGTSSTNADRSEIHEHFAILAEATRDGETRRASIAGSNIYDVTASIAALAAERLQDETELAGVLTPSDILDPADALAEIADEHDLQLELP